MSGRIRTRAYKAVGQAPEHFRIGFPAAFAAGTVDVDAGTAGAILGLAVATKGEAKGHGMFLDEAFLASLAAAGEVRARFTHPGISSDGLGKLLGRVRNFRLDAGGSMVRGDLFFLKSSHETPDGDLAAYVMQLADESPDLAGMSIVFDRDLGAEEVFRGEHSDEEGTFTSPDPLNKKNFDHVRLAELRGVDMVDEPAANPEGLFSADDGVLREAEAVVSYALGLSEECPAGALFGVHPERVRAFMAEYFERNELAVVGKTFTTTQVMFSPGWTAEEAAVYADAPDEETIEPGDVPLAEEDAATDTGAAQLEEVSIMDALAELSMDQLKEARPDLIEALRGPAREEGYAEGEGVERARALSIIADVGKYQLGLDVAVEHIEKGFSGDKAISEIRGAALEASKSSTKSVGANGESNGGDAPEKFENDEERDMAIAEKLRAADPNLSLGDALEEASLQRAI